MTPELWFSVIALLQAGDIYTTLRALRKGAVEANPLVRSLMDAIGVKEALLLVKIAALIPLWVSRGVMPEWVWVALVALYVWVVVNNVRVHCAMTNSLRRSSKLSKNSVNV